MKVLFVASLYHPHVGGIETVITELSSQYAQKGISSAILTKKWPDSLRPHSRYKGIHIYRVASVKSNKDFSEAKEWLIKNEKKIHCDIIHIIGMRRPLPLFALFLARRWNIPLVSTLAGSEIPERSDPETYNIWESSKEIMIPVLSESDAVTAFSKGLIKNAHKLPELKKLKIKLLYAGMHTEQFSKARKINSQPYIVCIRRLVFSKGVDILIKAFRRFAFEANGVTLVIVGDGPEMGNLIQLAKDLGLNHRVKFIGTVPLDMVASLLKGALMTVVPSRSEGGGLINLEAQAAGCPLIVSRVGGIPEYVQPGKENLIFFKVGDYNELYKKMIYLYRYKATKDALTKNGKKFVEQFDWKKLTPHYISLYSRLIKHYSKKHGPY